MAVTLTVDQLRNAVRVDDNTESNEILTRLLSVATERVQVNAPGAPEATQNEAVIRFAGYIYDQPNSSAARLDYSSAFRNSGAASLLLPWRVHSARSVKDAAAAAMDAASPGNPVTNVVVQGSNLVVTKADGSVASYPFPAGMGGDGTDETARAAAAAAQATADSKDDAFAWATEGNNDEPIPTEKLANVPSGGGDGSGNDAIARAVAMQAQATADSALETANANRVYLGAYSTLTDNEKAMVNLGEVTLRYNRFWIVHDLTQARANGPLDVDPDGWRAIDGQYRGSAPTTPRVYDTADHCTVGSNLYFCVLGGTYTSAQIQTSPNWINLTASAGDGTDETARAAAAAAQSTADTNAAAIEGISTSGPARTEVLVPFRPGSRPGAILIEATGYVVGGNYTSYGVPAYVSASGGYTISVDEAYDFRFELDGVILLTGSGVVDPIVELPDSPTLEGLTKIFRDIPGDTNSISAITTRPSAIITIHFVQNVGGSRYFNPDDRVAVFPHGGEATPNFNEGHQWIAGIGILAIGQEKRIELITDGNQPSGTLRVSLAVPGSAPVEHLVVPLVSDPNAYHSGLVSNIPDGQDLEFSISRNGTSRILHQGLHFERFILEEELGERLVPLQRRIVDLEEAAVAGAIAPELYKSPVGVNPLSDTPEDEDVLAVTLTGVMIPSITSKVKLSWAGVVLGAGGPIGDGIIWGRWAAGNTVTDSGSLVARIDVTGIGDTGATSILLPVADVELFTPAVVGEISIALFVRRQSGRFRLTSAHIIAEVYP